MSLSARPIIITGNWKMYKTIEQSIEFIRELPSLVKNDQTLVYLAVPFTAINASVKAAEGSNIVIGAQNMNDASEGAFTGEVAGKMLVNAGAKFVILGHSERRRIFNESNQFINRKVKRALSDGLQATLCIGEKASERDEGKTEAILEEQIRQGLEGITDLSHVILAYEPVWAIGTDRAATPEVAEKAQKFCRSVIASNWSQKAAEKIVIQYGGSVNSENAKALLEQPNVDGFLVGGASLSVETFAKIINTLSG